MRRSGHRILVDARSGREESGDEIVIAVRRATRDDDAAHRNLTQPAVIRLQRAHFVFRADLDDVVELVFADVLRRRDAERWKEIAGRIGFLFERRGKIELDQTVALLCGQQSAFGMKLRRFAGREQSLLPQRVRARERCVPAQRDFN